MTTATGARATLLDVEIQENATFILVHTVETAGVAVDITGAEAEFTIRDVAAGGALVLALTSSPVAGIVMGGAAGTVTVTITAAQTLAMGVGTFPARYGLRIVYADTTADRLSEGVVTFAPAQVR